MIRPLAALGALVASLFKRAPKKTTTEMLLRDAPKPARLEGSLRGNGKRSRALRKRRRQLIAFSFTRLLAHKPIGWGAVGEPGKAWRRGMEAYQRRFADARVNSTTVRRSR